MARRKACAKVVRRIFPLETLRVYCRDRALEDGSWVSPALRR